MKLTATRWLSLICLLLVLPVAPALGQSTTASITGSVVDQSGETIPGANVVAIHQPTGTQYGTATNAQGRFSILNMRVGGPYLVRASFVGYQTVEKTGVMLDLNEKATIDFQLRPKTEELEGVEVIAEREGVIDANRTGAATNIRQEQIDALPSISRSITDYARLTPQYTGGGSLAGNNDRYNSISVDGATLDDVFGLGDAVPGSQAGTQPISLDAIEEFQIDIAPYDVRKSGFTGGQINAVTKSGSNEFEGLVRYFGRNESFTGDLQGEGTGEFSRQYFIGNVGGPIIEDELFFFVNAEYVTQKNPQNTGIGPGPNNFQISGVDTRDYIDQVADISQNVYGYNPGGTSVISENQDSYKFLAKLDWNLNDNNRLTLRHNYVKGLDDSGLGRGENSFDFSSQLYQFSSVQNSTVLQLNTTLGDNMFNEARVVYTRIRDSRDIGDETFSDVTLVPSSDSQIQLGPGRFNQANRLDQDLVEITNDFSYVRGNHTFTLGTNNQIWSFSNLFIQDFYGQFEFEPLESDGDRVISALDAYERGQPTVYRYSYATEAAGTEKPIAEFTAFQVGLYAQDEWQALENLRLTFGLRADMPIIPDNPTFNPTAYEAFGVSTSSVATGNPIWSPRFGFNYSNDYLGEDFETQVRGGIGLFAGDPPFVWISNQFSNTGADFVRIEERFGYDDYYDGPNDTPGRRFVPTDLGENTREKLPRAGDNALITPVATTEINVISDDFKYPQVFRTNLAIDQQLPNGFAVTLEGLYSSTVNGVTFTNLNYEQTDESKYGRPIYGQTVSPRFTNALLLKNTNKGYSYSGTIQLQRQVREGLSGSLSYTLNEARSVNTGSSSRAISNWQFNENVDVNNPRLGRTDQALRHRVLGTLNYRLEYLDRFATTVGLIYDGRSGQPFSWIYAGNANGDTQSFNDLVYVPEGPNDVVLESENWESMNAFINAWDGLDDYRGGFTKRNIDMGPWSHQIDLQISQNIVTYQQQKLEITATMENVLNWINDDWGRQQFVQFQNSVAWDFSGYVESADVGSELGGRILTQDDVGKPIVSFDESNLQETASDELFQTSNIGSRWQVQLGLRYTF
ncbi:hypothetical protein CRI94_05490 [Longibacter salinarum]|uniref:TonB-dependent transporter Oar-like beta-barrel domain-containing protein n=1 Tax=Longibacter salinarum TaxID=1850348 RepID=A0A2A8D0I4_9BACT|nr:TonB-dependent receptor [Longibacter salinarum]PEN14479.1 hypothetical protein CRI94_05490 [Longibacter salinarum]